MWLFPPGPCVGPLAGGGCAARWRRCGEGNGFGDGCRSWLCRPEFGPDDGDKCAGVARARDSRYREWGLGGSINFDPGASERGLSLRLRSSWGAASSGINRLYSQRSTVGMARNPYVNSAGIFDAELRYGMDAPGGRGLLTPYADFAFSGRGHACLRPGLAPESGTIPQRQYDGLPPRAHRDSACAWGYAARCFVQVRREKALSFYYNLDWA